VNNEQTTICEGVLFALALSAIFIWLLGALP
jgi:hypothetical protein